MRTNTKKTKWGDKSEMVTGDTRVQRHDSLDDEDARGRRLSTKQPPEGTAEPWDGSLRGPQSSSTVSERPQLILITTTNIKSRKKKKKKLYFRNRFGSSSFISVSWPDVSSVSQPPFQTSGPPLEREKNWNWPDSFQHPQETTNIHVINVWNRRNVCSGSLN